MKKQMKKIGTVVFVATFMAVVATGCGKKVKCDFCGETKSCQKKTIFGEEVNICSDCQKDLNALGGN